MPGTWVIRPGTCARPWRPGCCPIGVLAGAAVDEDGLREAGAAVVWGTLEELLEVGWG